MALAKLEHRDDRREGRHPTGGRAAARGGRLARRRRRRRALIDLLARRERRDALVEQHRLDPDFGGVPGGVLMVEVVALVVALVVAVLHCFVPPSDQISYTLSCCSRAAAPCRSELRRFTTVGLLPLALCGARNKSSRGCCQRFSIADARRARSGLPAAASFTSEGESGRPSSSSSRLIFDRNPVGLGAARSKKAWPVREKFARSSSCGEWRSVDPSGWRWPGAGGTAAGTMWELVVSRWSAIGLPSAAPLDGLPARQSKEWSSAVWGLWNNLRKGVSQSLHPLERPQVWRAGTAHYDEA